MVPITLAPFPIPFPDGGLRLAEADLRTDRIDVFSTDASRNILYGNATQRRYLYEPYLRREQVTGLHMDLNKGIEGYVHRDHTNDPEGLQGMLEWLVHECPPTSAPTMREAFHDADIVMHRGPLVRIASTPYAKNDVEGWKLACVKYKGVIFAMAQYTDAGREISQQDELDPRAGYWGHKFEQEITRAANSSCPELHSSVDENVAMYAMIAATLSHGDEVIRVLYKAEIDAFDGSPTSDAMFELKTTAISATTNRFFPSKVLKWYLQARLADCSHVVVGKKNSQPLNHIVIEVEKYSLERLLSIGSNAWNAETCFAFLSAFLCRVKEEMNAHPEGSVLVAERPSGKTDHVEMVIHEASSEEAMQLGERILPEEKFKGKYPA